MELNNIQHFYLGLNWIEIFKIIKEHETQPNEKYIIYKCA